MCLYKIFYYGNEFFDIGNVLSLKSKEYHEIEEKNINTPRIVCLHNITGSILYRIKNMGTIIAIEAPGWLLFVKKSNILVNKL